MSLAEIVSLKIGALEKKKYGKLFLMTFFVIIKYVAFQNNTATMSNPTNILNLIGGIFYRKTTDLITDGIIIIYLLLLSILL